MADDPREALLDAMDPNGFWRGGPTMSRVVNEHADELLATLTEAGWRLMREDDLRWLVDNLDWAALGDPYSQAGDDLPTGVRVLLDEMEGK